jgi:hypothetical protein
MEASAQNWTPISCPEHDQSPLTQNHHGRNTTVYSDCENRSEDCKLEWNETIWLHILHRTIRNHLVISRLTGRSVNREEPLSLLKHSAVQSACKPTFRRNVSPTSSGLKIMWARHQLLVGGYLKMEAIRSSETSVHIPRTRRYIPLDSKFHNYRWDSLKSYIVKMNCLISCFRQTDGVKESKKWT